MSYSKIVLTGPESTGKTTLAQDLAAHYNTIYVPEYAREYIYKLNRNYRKSDLLAIAKGQIRLEKTLENHANKYLFCDTDLLVIKIWSLIKYKHCHHWILKMLEYQKPNLYLLCGIDTIWEYDPLREHPSLEVREYLYNLYYQELTYYHFPFIELTGSRSQRLEKAIVAIESI